MISQFSLSAAFYNHLNASTVIDIARDGEKFTPSPSGEYLMEKLVPTNELGRLGAGTDVQKGFYQVTVCTPISKGNLYNNSIVDIVRPLFPNGTQAAITHSGQQVSLSKFTPSGMYKDDTHLKTALTIAYTVIA
jgi:hypothetical protein